MIAKHPLTKIFRNLVILTLFSFQSLFASSSSDYLDALNNLEDHMNEFAMMSENELANNHGVLEQNISVLISDLEAVERSFRWSLNKQSLGMEATQVVSSARKLHLSVIDTLEYVAQDQLILVVRDKIMVSIEVMHPLCLGE
jgi:hypothetical protein